MPDSRSLLHRREPDAVLGLCRECHRPSFIDTAPPSLSEAVAQASQHMRLPKVRPRGEALRIWRAGVCECPRPGVSQWCAVCKLYHEDGLELGEKTDAGRLVRPCPRIAADDPRNRP